MELTRDEEMQAYVDALGAIVTAVAWQLDAKRLAVDLKALAVVTEQAGHGPSSDLIHDLAHTVEVRTLGASPKGH